MNFFNYLWSLLNRPLKKGTENKKWLTTLGEEFDELKQSIFKLRRAWLIKTASGKSLDLLGESRGLPRYKNEVDELYRERLLAAFDTYLFGGTYPAMKKTLSTLGYPDSEIQLLYEIDPQRWAEFNIFLDQERLKQLNNLDVVKKEVRRIKQASALPNYILTYYQTFRIRGRPIIGKSTTRPACGTIVANKNNFRKFYKFVGFLADSSFALDGMNIKEFHEPFVCSKKKKNINTGSSIIKDFNLVKTKESQINTIKVSSQKTKTMKKGFIEIGSFNMDSVKEKVYNQLPVCSKNFKSRKVVS
jgi:hypothetical protein